MLIKWIISFLTLSIDSGGGGGTQTVQQNADPWSGQQPHLLHGFQQARQLYDQGGPQYFPDSTVIPFSPQSETAMNLQQQRALMGSPVTQAGQQELTSTLSGDYLGSNPYLDQIAGNITDQTQSAIDSQFAQAGRFGGGAHAREAGEGISNSLANLYGQSYESERDRMMGSMGYAPQMAAQDYIDIGMLGDVGAQVEGKAGQQLQDQVNRFNFGQNQPQQNLQNYLGLIQGNYGGTSTTEQPIYGGGPMQGALGGGMAGLGLAGAMTEGGLASLGLAGAAPWALGGAALGGLLLS